MIATTFEVVLRMVVEVVLVMVAVEVVGLVVVIAVRVVMLSSFVLSDRGCCLAVVVVVVVVVVVIVYRTLQIPSAAASPENVVVTPLSRKVGQSSLLL